jgi:hypothetical protein
MIRGENVKKILLFLSVFLICNPSIAANIFHLKSGKNECLWKVYDVNTGKDKNYFTTPQCPNQIVWLKDKSFYYSIKSKIFWANQWSIKPVEVVDFMTAKKEFHKDSEVIWGVKGRFNSIYTLVIDPRLKHKVVNGKDTYQFKKHKIDPKTFRGIATEQKASGIIRAWNKGKKTWQTVGYKLVSRFNPSGFDEDLYNNSVLSSKQIINYNECGENNCEDLPTENRNDLNQMEKQLKLVDNGMESIGYLSLNSESGILFKKYLGEAQHPVKPYFLCENNCSKTQELELPKSFSDNFAMVKKGKHFLLFNENKASVGNLYSFNSPIPLKSFTGPMVFWHPF